MPRRKIIFTNSEQRIYKKFFQKGISVAGLILLTLKETGEGFLTDLPDCYPGFKLMKRMFGIRRHKLPPIKKEVLRVNLARLKKQGLIAKDPKQKTFVLTEEGKRIIIEIENRYLILRRPWDGKLRLFIFDIPENKREWRKWLRNELLSLKFKALQKSVYVGYHPLPESFYRTLMENSLNKFIFMLTVGEMEKKEDVLKLLNS